MDDIAIYGYLLVAISFLLITLFPFLLLSIKRSEAARFWRNYTNDKIRVLVDSLSGCSTQNLPGPGRGGSQ